MAVLLGNRESHQLTPTLQPRSSITLQSILSPSLRAAPPPVPDRERATTGPAVVIPSSPVMTASTSYIATGQSEILLPSERRSSLISAGGGGSPRLSAVGSTSAAVRGHPNYGASPSPAWQPLAAPHVLASPYSERQVVGSPSIHYASAPRSSLSQASNGKQRWATLNELELAGETLLPGSVSLGLPEPALSGSHTSAQSENAGNVAGNGVGTSAPSSALLAAVQLAAASSSKVTGEIGTPSSDTPPTLADNPPPAGRRRWASMTEEEMTSGSRSRKSSLLAGFGSNLGQDKQGTPVQRPAPAPAMANAFVPNFAPARRRWASISDDEASPMIWPMKSPHMGRIMQQSGRRSLSSTPVIGPASQPGVSSSQQLPTQAVPSSPFMLPTAAPGMPPTLAMNPMCQMGMPMGMQGMPMAPPGYGMPMQAMPPTAPGTWGGNASSYLFPGGAMQNTVTERTMVTERPGRTLNGWTVIWVGERAFRASAAAKEQIESTGFLVKIYRSHDKCCRALDKKPHLSPTTVYVVSEVDAEQMLAYVCRRGATDVHIVVDAQGPAEAQMLLQRLTFPEDAFVTVADCWEAVLSALRAEAGEIAARAPLDQPALQPNVKVVPVSAAVAASQRASPPRVVPMSEVVGHAGASTTSSIPMVQTDNPWTLIWISDQAFKPAAVALKTQLETLGGQVKGYKTHKNAARALDKKRALTRTVVLVSGPEAAPFLAYIQGRPELANTRVVVEASSRSAPVRESPTVEVVESFETAMDAVQRIVVEPGFS